jgi:hypothetical protein
MSLHSVALSLTRTRLRRKRADAINPVCSDLCCAAPQAVFSLREWLARRAHPVLAPGWTLQQAAPQAVES